MGAGEHGKAGEHGNTHGRLSRELFVEAALALIDRDGVDGLSMRRLGTELGVDPMAVYHYFPNKAAVLDAIVEALYAEMEQEPAPAGLSWREYLVWFFSRLRSVLRRHPHAIGTFATRPSYAPATLLSGDRALGVVMRSGLSARQALILVNCLRGFTIGRLLAEVSDPVGGPVPAPEEAGTAMDAETFPHLALAIAAGYDADEQFELGLEALITGFEKTLLP